MSGDWIKMRGNLWDDPRVAAICERTDSSEATVIGALYWLWATADQHTEDGCMPGLTLRQIDRKTGLAGFGAALCAVDWIVDDPQGIVIRRFEEHNGTSAKRRCTDAQRKAAVRGMSASDADNLRTNEGQKTPNLGARDREEKKEEIQASGVPDAVDGQSSDRPQLALVGIPDKPRKPAPPLPDCPHQALVALYAKHLPHLRQPAVWDGQRAEAMRTRWRQCSRPTAFGDGYATEAEGLAFWDRFFAFVAGCPKLRDGITSTSGGQVRVWKPDLPWLLKAENFAKVIEGAYSP